MPWRAARGLVLSQPVESSDEFSDDPANSVCLVRLAAILLVATDLSEDTI
jgi:hypothetical protein